MKHARTLSLPGYQMVQFLGTGSRSTIWQLREIRTGKLFAIKRTVKRESNDYRYLEQAIREFEVGSRLDHPNLRKVFWMRRVRSLLLAVREVHVLMEYCPGKSVQEKPPETVPAAVTAFLQVAAAIGHMNREGFVHADMKPNNIIVGPDEQVKVIDFGQSCRVGTVKERIQGTPDFIAPEQVYRRPLDARTDVFNFGATLYWVLTGRPIPTAMPEENAVLPPQQTALIPPNQLNPAVPASLAKLVMDCIELQPARRPASMNEVTSRLELVEHSIQRADQGK